MAATQVALVTGATSGIGKAVAVGLAKAGARLVLLVRDETRGKAAIAEITRAVPSASVELLLADLSSQKAVRNAAKEAARRFPDLNVLVNAAGVFLPTRTVTADGIETTFATNYLGHFLLTNLLLPTLTKNAPARIVSVASRYGGTKIDFDDLNLEKRKFSYLKAVPPTKLAQVLFTQELAERISGSGVVVNAIHPGLVAHTALLEQTRGPFRVITNLVGKTPEVGADTAVWLATAPETANVTGGMWAKRTRMKTPGQGSDPAARARLWEESVKMTGLTSAPKAREAVVAVT